MLGSIKIDSCSLARIIVLKFTLETWVAKEMNCSLLEKIQCLLSNAQLDKLFWAETLEYASHLITRFVVDCDRK